MARDYVEVVTVFRYSQDMRITLAKLSIPLLLFLSFAGNSTAQESKLSTCLKQVADEDLANKINFQNKMRDLIVESQNDLEELATLQRDSQIARAQRRKNQLHFLLNTKPEQVVADKGMVKFRNFDWSDGDQQDYLNQNEMNRTLSEEIEAIELKSKSHPDWPKMREYFKETLRVSPEFQNLTRNFMQTQMETKALLSSCKQ